MGGEWFTQEWKHSIVITGSLSEMGKRILGAKQGRKGGSEAKWFERSKSKPYLGPVCQEQANSNESHLNKKQVQSWWCKFSVKVLG